MEFKNRYLNNIRKYKTNYLNEDIEEVFNRVYNVVFMDIDKTIIENDKFDIDLLKSIYFILNKGVNIYFITGRGRTSAKNVISELIISLTKVMNKSKIEFAEQIFLITNNGLNFFYTDKNLNDKLFNKHRIIIDKDRLNKFKEQKNIIIKNVTEIIYNSKTVNLNLNELIQINKNYSGELSIRFAFDKENIIDEQRLKKVINEYIQNEYNDYYFFEGLYKNKKILEISLLDKNDALKKLLPALGVNNKHILKIGDQAGKYGNDFLFLNNLGGFSVNEFLCNGKVLPVLNKNGEILKGVKATKELIENLKIYPPICLENVDKKLYSEKLAYYENNLEKRHKEIVNSYDKLISKSFSFDNNKYVITDIIDIISGGIFISDSEFYLLKKQNPKHLLFDLFGLKEKENYI